MEIWLLEIMLALGIAGHAINRWCDYVLAVYPNGKITIDTMNDVNDESKMAHLMKGTDPDLPFKSAMYGVVSLFMEFLGYTAIALYISEYHRIFGGILFLCAALFAILGSGHHVKYALGVWMFIKGGCSKTSYQHLNELYNKIPVTKAAYIGYVLFVVTLIAAIVSGVTPLPLWAVIFTVLPVFVAMIPFKIIGTLHFSAIITFAGWIVMILLFS